MRPEPSHDPNASAATPAATPVVDHAGGIARLMGDGALFARVLARFRKEYRHAGDKIRDALDAHDLALAQRLAHTLKGAAAMIEAVPLRQQAQALEQLLRADAHARLVEAQLVQLDQALEQVLEELDALAAVADNQPAPPRKQEQEQGTLHHHARTRLRALLEDGNGDAVDMVRDARASLAAELGEDRYRELAAAIQSFDFDGALALLGSHDPQRG